MSGSPQAPSDSVRAFATAIGVAEGYGVSGAIPTVRDDPGDLTDGTATIRTFATAEAGWEALFTLIYLVLAGTSRFYRPTMTVQAFANTYTATQATAWASNVAWSLNKQSVRDAAGQPITVNSPLDTFLEA